MVDVAPDLSSGPAGCISHVTGACSSPSALQPVLQPLHCCCSWEPEAPRQRPKCKSSSVTGGWCRYIVEKGLVLSFPCCLLCGLSVAIALLGFVSYSAALWGTARRLCWSVVSTTKLLAWSSLENEPCVCLCVCTGETKVHATQKKPVRALQS